MAFLDRVKARISKLTGEDALDAPIDDDSARIDGRPLAPSVDLDGAYALLELDEAATLDEARIKYRVKAQLQHPLAKAAGADSDDQRALERLLEALELVEEALVPLAGNAHAGSSSSTSTSTTSAKDAPKRKRATERKA